MAAAVTLKIFRLVDFLFYDSAPPDKSAASTDTVVKLIRIRPLSSVRSRT